MRRTSLEDIKEILNMEDDTIRAKYRSWDSGDCSLVGLAKILLFQCIQEHKIENGEYYDRDYDNLMEEL